MATIVKRKRNLGLLEFNFQKVKPQLGWYVLQNGDIVPPSSEVNRKNVKAVCLNEREALFLPSLCFAGTIDVLSSYCNRMGCKIASHKTNKFVWERWDTLAPILSMLDCRLNGEFPYYFISDGKSSDNEIEVYNAYYSNIDTIKVDEEACFLCIIEL